MKLKPLTLEDCILATKWRNDSLPYLRTNFPCTEESQRRFFEDIVSDPNSSHRYWGIADGETIGIGGIINIQPINAIGEISLIIHPQRQGRGYGEQAVDLLLCEAFNNLNLKTVFGECYHNNPAVSFWEGITKKYNGYVTVLPNRKYWDGKYYDSRYFSIEKDEFNKIYSPV